ncbi:MAG: prepilin-type N-terminal cleavage/methylation domain-containing protein [Candidatus Omnitrophota bacterium]
MTKVKKGFTLIEVLIVLLSIGALATLVVPRYFAQNERAYVAEAVAMLSALRQAEVAYNLENSPLYATSVSSLDIDAPSSTKFTFAVDSVGTSTATRSGGASGFVSTTIILNIAGTWSGTHPYKPT